MKASILTLVAAITLVGVLAFQGQSEEAILVPAADMASRYVKVEGDFCPIAPEYEIKLGILGKSLAKELVGETHFETTSISRVKLQSN